MVLFDQFVCVNNGYITILISTQYDNMQATFSIRLDEETKRAMDELCDSLGLSMSAAFNIFAKAFVRDGGFPFDVKCASASDPMESFWEARRILRERYPEEPSLEEIDEEIRKVRRLRSKE